MRRPRSRRPISDEERALFVRAVAELEADGEVAGASLGLDKETRDAQAQHRARFARRVARAEIEPAASLDLHGLDRHRSATRLREFLGGARRAAHECVLIVHGKGERILAQEVSRLLDQHPAVAEHVQAPRRLGGSGARLVRLRRSR